MKLGYALKIARLKSGLRQEELAKLLQVSSNYISLLENDKRDPSWSFVCKICEILRIPLPLLLLLAPTETDKNERLDSIKSLLSDHLIEILMVDKQR